jgi:hypothetical protein
MLFRVNQHPFQPEAAHVAPALPCGNALNYASPRGFELALVGRCVS